jgi:fructose/tagatose bisphosphate aldolase
MPLILDRTAVLDSYARAAENRWVVPTFCSENLTTTEAILAAAVEHGRRLGQADIPVTLAMTNQYSHRSQSVNFTRTGQWDIGLQLFLAELDVLTAPGSPFADLDVMILLDHAQWDTDKSLLWDWDMCQFSMVMYDASALPFEQNMEKTAAFVQARGGEVVIEGACDEIVDATGEDKSDLTTPDRAERYIEQTGVDYIVANLGTEHRASAAELKYHGDLARTIRDRIGQKLVLHGTSSVETEQVRSLFDDGIAKVNIWTCLERDSSPELLRQMVTHAAKVAGPGVAGELAGAELLGPSADTQSRADLGFYTTTWRQSIIFERMKEIAGQYFQLWYT